jgi:uncharacterized integral membrane protein
MRNLKRVLLGVFILVLVMVILSFTLENQQSTSLIFLGWSSAQMPVAAYMLLAFLVGMVIGPLLALLFGRRAARRL